MSKDPPRPDDEKMHWRDRIARMEREVRARGKEWEDKIRAFDERVEICSRQKLESEGKSLNGKQKKQADKENDRQ